MALRVLLADNSETIKKVIQLTLKDFDIDLRVVTLGVDVLDVALQFKPDIIFVDILLQKKNGYEVSKEIKNNVNLKDTPVVLMWSGFMELDEPKAKESLADDRIEKPFDAETLKNLVTQLVKKSDEPAGSIEDFLEMPSTPKEPTPKAGKNDDPLASLEKLDKESEKFKPIELPDLTEGLDQEDDSKQEPADEFEMQPLDKTTGFGYRETEQTKSFILDLPEDTNVDAIPLDVENVENVEDMSFLLNPETAANFQMPGKEAPSKEVTAPSEKPPEIPSAPPVPSENDIEKMVREEVREVLEKVAWQVIPELAAEIIRKELDRLLQENEPKP